MRLRKHIVCADSVEIPALRAEMTELAAGVAKLVAGNGVGYRYDRISGRQRSWWNRHRPPYESSVWGSGLVALVLHMGAFSKLCPHVEDADLFAFLNCGSERWPV